MLYLSQLIKFIMFHSYNSNHIGLMSRQVCCHHREDRLRQGAGSGPLPPVEPAAQRVVSLELAVPSPTGARQPEEAGPEPAAGSAGTARTEPERLSAFNLTCPLFLLSCELIQKEIKINIKCFRSFYFNGIVTDINSCTMADLGQIYTF